uniref:Putative replication protein VP4 n=1 Tax=uncultured virus TaxID=340016 RepID=A0A1D8MK81_9VIRU|nr:putative replication protein VP4 [uncultured virus]
MADYFAKHSDHIVFDCGKCLSCRKKKAYELASRCLLHASLYENNCFLTLTYDETKEGYHNTFEYPDIQKFKKRLRQHCQRNHNGLRIEIFNVHEYGKNGKKHWHLIVFNYSPHQEPDQNKQPDCTVHSRSHGIGLYVSKTLSRLWPHGFSTVGDISGASAMYTAQYVNKDFKNGNTANSKKSHSKHSGIGRPYFLKHYNQILRLGYVPVDGKKLPVPRYFQKLAHKHYCHFYEPSAFFDTEDRKALYRPFKKEQPNVEIAELYKAFRLKKQEHVKELEERWAEILGHHLTSKETPDFIKSNSNQVYDLRKKLTTERF